MGTIVLCHALIPSPAWQLSVDDGCHQTILNTTWVLDNSVQFCYSVLGDRTELTGNRLSATRWPSLLSANPKIKYHLCFCLAVSLDPFCLQTQAVHTHAYIFKWQRWEKPNQEFALLIDKWASIVQTRWTKEELENWRDRAKAVNVGMGQKGNHREKECTDRRRAFLPPPTPDILIKTVRKLSYPECNLPEMSLEV